MTKVVDYKTDQEKFWAGDFGTNYIQRNQSAELLASNLSFFSKALRLTRELDTCIEYGANIGMNLRALRLLYPKLILHAVEVNQEAARELAQVVPSEHIFTGSILEFPVNRKYDLVMMKGVLIHINPDELSNVYDKMVEAAAKYLLIAEYYNPSPVSVSYRGHADRLFKRDFAGEIIDRHPQMKLIDYGFVYRRDPAFALDDITWFLMEMR